MNRDLLKMFEYEQKRRPELASLAANVGNMLDVEIDNAPVPLPWMRQALHRMKVQQQVKILAHLVEKSVVDGVNPDPEGVMCEWKGDDTFIKVGRTALLVTPGTLLWIGQSGIWIDTIYTAEIDPKVRPNIVARGKVTRSAYNAAVRDKARKYAPTDVPMTVAPGAVSAAPPSVQGVTFYRPG